MVEQRLRAIELVNEMVGGGSEFMANFERACEALRIPLEGLPPRHPQLNSLVCPLTPL